MMPPSEYQNNTANSELTRFMQTIRRRFWYVFGFVALVTSFAVYIGATQEPTYTASVQIVLEPGDDTNSANEFVAGSLSKDASAIETQIKLLRTQNHIQNVIKALDLERRWADRLFFDDDSDQALPEEEYSSPGFFQSWGTALANLAVGEGGPVAPVREQAEEPAQRPAVPNETKMDMLQGLFLDNFFVQQEGKSYVISIYFTSEDPSEAAEIANATADIFIETKHAEKLSVTDRTSQWLSKRADSLYRELQTLEEEIAQFRENNPIDVRQPPGANSEISFLTSELAGIRGELSAKVATLTLAEKTKNGKGDLRGIAEINTSVTLRDLLSEQLNLLAREAELGKTYGERHPLMIQHLDEQRRLKIKIEQEIDRIVASIENDVRILQARRRSLEQEVTKLRRDDAGKAKVTFQLEDLLRRADNTRALYRNVLQRSKEINEQQEIVQPDVRLVSRAATPRVPSSPDAKVYGVVGFCASSIFSIMLVVFLDRLDKRLRTPGQIKEKFGLETAALVPQVAKNMSPQRRLIETPRSIYADSMRSIYMAVRQASPGDDEGQVILTTSSLPDEGKSTMSLSLATAVALQKRKVLLIDMDLRHPQIHKMIAYQPKNGIVEYCRNSSFGLDNCIHYERATGLHYLLVKKLPRDPSATISSERFPLLMEQLREEFDLIVIDAAPVLAVSETRLLLPHVDVVNFCIRWGKTDVDTVAEAIATIRSAETTSRILAVLTRVDLGGKGASYGLNSSRHRKAFKKYYQEA